MFVNYCLLSLPVIDCNIIDLIRYYVDLFTYFAHVSVNIISLWYDKATELYQM